MRSFAFSIAILFMLCTACKQDEISIPKPRIFPKVNFPQKSYTSFSNEDCAFAFNRGNYTLIEKDTAFFDEKPVDPCWFDLVYPSFDARIHFSYYPITKHKDFEQLRNEAFVLAQKHNIKANYIDELPLMKNEFVKGIIFQMDGAVASPVQFYLSDERSHFLRGSLYFNTQSRPDSLMPIVDFIKDDISELVNSFAWK